MTRMSKTCLFILSALVVAQVNSFPRGAPTTTCGSMVPIHMLFAAQKTKAPFSLLVGNADANAGAPIKGNQLIASFEIKRFV